LFIFAPALLRSVDSAQPRRPRPNAWERTRRPLDLLAEVVQDLPEDDERLMVLETLAVRDGQFVPGAATEHALTQFASTSREACDAFLTMLVRVARDDAIARARTHGHLPPQRPR